MPSIDWRAMFTPTANLLELVLRAALTFGFILVGLRILHREVGEITPADVLVIILIGDVAAFAMDIEATSVSEAAVMIATIFACNYGLDWLASRYPWAHRMLHARPRALIRNGIVQRKNLRRELLTMDDLHSQLRQHGVEDVAEVKICYLEPDGRLSVLKHSSEAGEHQRRGPT